MESPRRAALRISLVYAIVSGLWILFSDRIVALLPDELEMRLQTIKGLLFVLVTSLIIYALIRRWASQVLDEARHSASLEHVLGQVVETVPVGVLLLAEDGVITFMNPAAELLLGVNAEASVGRRVDELGIMEDSEATMGALMSSGALDGLRLRSPETGAERAVIVRAAHIDEPRPGSGWVLAVADITSGLEAHERVDQLLKGYQFLSEAAIAAAKAGDSATVLREVCRIAVNSRTMIGVWAMLTYTDEPGRFENVFGGVGEATESAAKLLMESYGPDGQMGSRLVDGEIVVFNDVVHDPRSPWYSAALEDGFGSVGSLAIVGPSGVYVSFTLFTQTPGFFSSEQVAVMKTLRGTLGFAVDRIELDRRRIETEEALEASETAYRGMFESNPEMMWVVDLETMEFLAVNQAVVARYGYTRDEFLTMKVTDIRDAEAVPRFLEMFRAHRDGGFQDMGVWEHKDKNGQPIRVHARVNSVEWNGHNAELVMLTEVPTA